MGTFGGLLAGAKYFKAPFEVIGIPVSPTYRSPEQVAEFIDKLSAEYELGIHVTPEEVRIETGTPEEPYYGIAYNVPDPVTQQYMALLARTEGLFTDPCYTGKIFHGFVDLVRSGKIPEGENPSSCTRAVHRQSGARSIWMRLRRSSMTAKACSYTRHKTLKYPGTLSPVNKKYGTRFSGSHVFCVFQPGDGNTSGFGAGVPESCIPHRPGQGSARLKVFLRMKPGRISMQNYFSISLA